MSMSIINVLFYLVFPPNKMCVKMFMKCWFRCTHILSNAKMNINWNNSQYWKMMDQSTFSCNSVIGKYVVLILIFIYFTFFYYMWSELDNKIKHDFRSTFKYIKYMTKNYYLLNILYHFTYYNVILKKNMKYK